MPAGVVPWYVGQLSVFGCSKASTGTSCAEVDDARSVTSASDSAKRLQVRQHVMHVIVAVLSELFDVRLERIVESEPHL